MAKNKEREKKDFLISTRKKIGYGLTNAPVWAMQKAGKRLWSRKAVRHWRRTKLGKMFEKAQRKQGKS